MSKEQGNSGYDFFQNVSAPQGGENYGQIPVNLPPFAQQAQPQMPPANLPPGEDEEEGEQEYEGESDEEGEYDDNDNGPNQPQGTGFAPFQPEVDTTKITPPPPESLGFDATLPPQDDEERDVPGPKIVPGFGFGHDARASRGVHLLPYKQGDSLKQPGPIRTPPMMETATIPPPGPPRRVGQQVDTPVDTKFNTFGQPPQRASTPISGSMGGMESVHKTSQPNTLPHPRFGTYNALPTQPDTTPLFYHMLTMHRGKEEDDEGEKVGNFPDAQSGAEFIRASTRSAPNTPQLLEKFGLPFGVTMNPFAKRLDGKKVPTVSLGFTEVIRCYNCRSYVNPFVNFMDRGYKWKCNICKSMNDVPKCYYSKLDDYGCRQDILRRKELRYGSIEFIAPKRYNTRLAYHPMSFVFVIDVSYQMGASGALPVICNSIKESLRTMPSGQRTKVSIITFDKTIHFYSLNPRNDQPKMMVVGELNQTLLPIPKHLISSLMDSRDLIHQILEMIPKEECFGKNHITEKAMFSAMSSAARLLSKTGGKVVTFISGLPNVGKLALKNRAGSTQGSSIEQLLSPASTEYKSTALEFSKDVISVDLFSISDQYVDLASLGCFPKYTCGSVHHYPNFSQKENADCKRLEMDIRELIEETLGFDGVMRIRVSEGFKIANFHGNFFIKGHNLLSLPYVDSQKGYAVEFAHTGKFVNTQNMSVQTAVLFTTPSGERRIRVHNLTVPIVSSLSDLYKNSDVFCSIDILGRSIAGEIARTGLEAQRKRLVGNVAKCIRTYRNEVRNAAMHNYNLLVLADNLRLLPLLTMGLLKTPLFIDAKVVPFPVDHRSACLHSLNTRDTRKMILGIYPLLIDVLGSDTGKYYEDGNPENITLLPLSRSSLKGNGVCMMNTGERLLVHVGEAIQKREGFIEGLSDLATYFNEKVIIDLEECNEKAEEITDECVLKVLHLIVDMRDKYGYLSTEIVTSNSRNSNKFLVKLVEDRFSETTYGSSYDKFIVSLHSMVVN